MRKILASFLALVLSFGPVLAGGSNAGLPIIGLPVINATNTSVLTVDSSGLLRSTAGTLGTAAFQPTGTSGAAIPFLNGTNVWSGSNTFASPAIGTVPVVIKIAAGQTAAALEFRDSTGATLLSRFTASGDNFQTTSALTVVDSSFSNAYIRLRNASNIGLLEINSTGSINWNNSTVGNTLDLILTRSAAANLQLGAADAASPVAQGLRVQSVVAGTSNTAGTDWTFKASVGTGTGAGGNFIFQTAPLSTTGSTQNALVSAFTIDSKVHIRTGGSAPALSSCGTGSPTISGTDHAGLVTAGTAATGCVITFNIAYTSTPYCTVTWQGTPLLSQSYVVSTTAITLTQTSTSGDLINYVCVAQSGG